MTREEHAAYLAAMIDGEGCIKFQEGKPRAVNRTNRVVRQVEIVNCDRDIIRAVCEALEVLGINYTLRYDRRPGGRAWSPIWKINIMRRASFQVLAREVPIRSTRKQEKLFAILGSYRYSEERCAKVVGGGRVTTEKEEL